MCIFEKRFEVEKLTDQSFYQKVVGREEGEIWFIDFAANWCRPCQHMLPEFKEAAKSLRGRVNFGYVECTQYQSICQGFGVQSYPSLFLFPAKTPSNIGPVCNILSNNKIVNAELKFSNENKTPIW